MSRYQVLSENFIREFKDYVCWSNVCKYQKLSEDFMKAMKDDDKLRWQIISEYQSFSLDFIIKMEKYLSKRELLNNMIIYLPKEFIRRHL